MKIAGNNKKFEPCPEFTGRAVCVDITDLKKVNTQYGEQEKFRIVFEIDLEQRTKIDGKDGVRPWAVWSKGFTLSLHEKSGLRKFIRGWIGRDLTEEEDTLFDLDSLLGKPAFLVITHEPSKDGTETFANIAAITPHKQGEPLKPSGKFVRQKDRNKEANGSPKDSSYRQTEAPMDNDDSGPQPQAGGSFLTTKVHVGRFKGTELRELSGESIEALTTHWLPSAKSNPKPTADDRRLIAALDWYLAVKKAEADRKAQETATDFVPY